MGVPQPQKLCQTQYEQRQARTPPAPHGPKTRLAPLTTARRRKPPDCECARRCGQISTTEITELHGIYVGWAPPTLLILSNLRIVMPDSACPGLDPGIRHPGRVHSAIRKRIVPAMKFWLEQSGPRIRSGVTKRNPFRRPNQQVSPLRDAPFHFASLRSR